MRKTFRISFFVISLLLINSVFAYEEMAYPKSVVNCGTTNPTYGCDDYGCCTSPEYAISGPDDLYAKYRYINGYADYDLGGWYNVNRFYISTYSGLDCSPDCSCDPSARDARQVLHVWYSSNQVDWFEGIPDGIMSCSWDVKTYPVYWNNVRYIRLGRMNGGPGRGNPVVDVFYTSGSKIRDGETRDFNPQGFDEKGSIISIIILIVIIVFIFSWSRTKENELTMKKFFKKSFLIVY